MRYHIDPVCNGNGVWHANRSTTRKEVAKETLPRALDDIWTRNAVVPESVEACVHGLIKRIVCEQPSAPAVCSWDGNLSYGELDKLSSNLARQLVQLGVGPATMVLLSFEKSVLMPIAALAVMKAGGASVALDVTQPEDHLRILASRVSAPFILSSAANESLARQLGGHVLVVDREQLAGPPTKQLQHELFPLVTPSDVLYVVFTSGCTGAPKGAVITHRNFSSAIAYQQKALGFTSSSRVYDYASYASHVAWYNLVHALTCGGCLCIPSEADRRSNVSASIAELGANYAQLPPSVARALHLSQLPALRQLNLVGEPSSPLEAEELGRADIATVSAYGLSETASLAVVWAANGAESVHQPPAGVCAWVVDSEDPRSLAPFGAEGELWLEGPLVGPGYLNDPDRTAAAFVQDPEWLLRGTPKWPGRRGRTHRTGDLVRYDDNGQLVFVGRREQPRVGGGKRVDPSAIEHHLRQAALPLIDNNEDDFDGLQLIAETIQPQGAESAVLVAFVALDGARDMPDERYGEAAHRVAARLSEGLSAALPPHMVPEAFIPIQAVPMTATGKIDRHCLRSIGSLLTEPEMARLRGAGRPAPRSEAERLMAELWAQALQTELSSLGRDDDFFASGGDATAALRLSRLARERKLPLEAREVFRTPRLRDMAAWAATQTPWAATQKSSPLAATEMISSPLAAFPPPLSLLERPVDEAEIRAQAARLCRVSDALVLDVLPCTPLQAGLLALTAQQAGAYVAHNVFELGPDVDVNRFRASWDQVVALNPILRTRIVSLPRHGVVQVVLEEGAHWYSGSGCADDYRLDKASRTMGLGTPLSRFALFEDGGPRQFVWEVHHALYDGWSLPLLMQEAEHVYYGEFSPPLEPMTNLIKYISERDEATTKAFWQAQFTGIKGAHFPAPRSAAPYEPRPDSQMTRAVSGLEWGRGDVTPASVIRAAWAIMVAHSADSDEALFGLTVTGRQAAVPGIERMAGPAIATVPVRVVVDWDDSVSRLLGAVQRQAADMIPYEQTGLQRIRRVSEAAAVACSFQSLLVIQPGGGGDADSSDTAGRVFLTEPAVDHHATTQWQDFSTYAVVVECQLDSDEVRLRIGFDSTVVGRQQMDRIARGFESVLRLLCAEKRAKDRLRAAVVPSLSQASIDDIWRWNATVPAAVEGRIHDLVSQRARERPQAPAVCAWDGELTYGQLDDLSTKLALNLVARGVTGTIVPLFFEKSMWMPVAALAVMKAGGASIAMETTQPEERLRGIAAQADSPVVLASVQKSALARGLVSAEVMTVGPNQPAPDADSKEVASLPVVDPSSILYIVFTSGSTGTPKGAIVTHSNFASAAAYQQLPLGYDANSRVFDFASYAFDASWYNLLNALTVGGCLCIPSAEERENNLSGSIEKYKVTTADLTPSVARFLGPETLSHLSTLILGGEAVLPSDALLAGDKTKIINVYGPAECTPTITLAPVVKEDKDGVTIGRGAGVCTWVVHPEDDSCLAPIGAVGELWVEGPLVGRGYLNDAEKTAAAFVQDPVWLTQGGRSGRVYRTGDLVRYREDGSLLFVGRKDTQVKIRGQRIELGEVEHHVLRALEPVEGVDVSNAQVVAETIKPDEAKGAILVAFIVLESAASTSEKDHAAAVAKLTHGLADRLALTLPGFMIPSAFIPAHGIPMSGTGKTDRRLLQTMGAASWLRHRAAADKVEPATDLTELEKLLQQIWISVLLLLPEEASVNKLFTRLGGDSISAMQVVSQCRLHGLSLTASDVLQAGTIRKLAQRCQTVTGQQPIAESSSEDETAGNEPFDLTPIQQMFFEAYPDGLDHYNQSFILDLGQPASIKTLRAAMRALVSRHEMLRARYFKDVSAGDRWRQRILDEDDDTAYAFTHQAVARRDDMAEAAQRRQETLDIRTGPVFACDVFDVAGEQSLVLSAHHLVIDLVSWRIIWADIEDFVRQGSMRSQRTASFRAWCRRQARVGSGLSPLDVLPFPVPAPELGFWALPARENTFGDCVNLTETIGRETSTLVLGDANDSLRTEPVDLLVASVVHSFVRAFPERPPPVVWLEGHGREQSAELPYDVSETVGWFTTMYPVPVPAAAAGGSLLEAVRTAKDTRRKVPGKGQPYFACRYHSVAGREAFAGHDVAEITLNFTGRYQQLESEESLFGRAEQPAEAERSITEVSESAPRTAMIEINAGVEDGRLGVSFCFHRRMRHQDRLRRWAENGFGAALSSLARELRQAPSAPTLTDLPLLPLSYHGLDELLLRQLPAMGIRPENVTDMYPCSPLQEGILLSAFKGAATYDTFSVYRCAPNVAGSSVSPARLEAAWRRVVARHSILSTVFTLHPEGGGFVQIVVPESPVRVAHTTSSGSSPVAALSLIERPVFGPGDPRVAFTVCRSDAGDIAVRLDLSHALIDAYSMSILVQELVAAYDDCEMPSAPSFIDMVRFIDSTPKAQRLASWTALLEGVEPCVVPVTEPSPGLDVDEGHGDVSLPTNLASAITGFCREMGITRSVFLQVAWSMALSHFTGMQEACFGYLASGRDAPVDKIETMVGPLANLLIGRIDLRRPARQVLEKALQHSIEHLSMQHASLAEIQHHLGISGRRLFNTSLSIREADKLKATDNRTITLDSDVGEDPHEYDLSLSANIDGAKMDIVMEYREPYISKGVAREACITLEKAIDYLLSVGADEENLEPLFDGFFKRVVGADQDSASAFWKAQFAGIQGSNFPPVKSGASHAELDGRVQLDISGLNWDRADCTALVRAAWSMVTARSMGSDEISFGAVVGSQDAPAVVPVRVQLDWEAGTEKLLGDIRSQAAVMATYQHTGLARIRCMSDEAALACDFKTLLVIRSAEEQVESNRDGSHAMLVEVETRNADDARVCITFDSHSISEARVSRVTHQFQHVLRQLAGPAKARLRDITVVSQRDLDDIWTWNATVPALVEGCLHDLIEQRAREQPLAPAIDAWDGSLTYGQLSELSTRLAHQLVGQGVQQGCVVPLVFEKSMWMPVAALAVMKAGGASVAVDSTQPEERIRVIATQARSAGRLVVVCSIANEALVRRLEPDALVSIGLDRLPESLPERYPVLPTVSPTDVLYIVFTSGSTGRPKGAIVSHQNFYSAVVYQRDDLGYRSNSRVFDFASYAFDIAWSNLLNTLTAGACLCIPSAAERENNLPGSLEKYRVTVADLTPSVARFIEPKSSLSNLSTLLLGGEVVLPSDALIVPDHTLVVSAYGPAECTPTSTILHLKSSSEMGIGRAAGLCTWVVDMDNPEALAPIGAIGELWLEGPLVGLGYLDEPEKTAAAFIQDPEWLVRGAPGTREGRRGSVYRTGDLVQYKEDGTLLFVGRKDTQVKIRGQRVELGEVEHHVLRAIKAAEPAASFQIIAETIQPKGADSKTLVAFVALDGAKDMTPDEYDDKVRQATAGLNDRLAETLPVFMLPTAYVPLQTVPMMATGKADRRQLRAIGSSLSTRDIARLSRVEGDRRPPRTDSERTMQALWAEVLKVDPESIGIDDSFFRIGGDSIGAMRLVGIARQQGLGLSVRDIFQNPVLRDLAAVENHSSVPS